MSDFRLKVFVSVAQHLSFTKASQELFISQPAISKHIQELESTYQTRLFERQGNKIILTEAGRIFLKHSQKLLNDYEQLSYEMHLLHNSLNGKLRIGASSTIAHYVLPILLAQYKEKFPSVELSLLTGNSADIETALQEQNIDLGLVEGNNRLLSLRYTPFMDDELVAVVSGRNEIIQKEELTLHELIETPLILRENGSGTLEIIKTALSKHGLKLSDMNILLQMDSTEAIKRYIEVSNAMAIVSISAVNRELLQDRLRVVELTGLALSREFAFVQRMGVETPIANSFYDFMIRLLTK